MRAHAILQKKSFHGVGKKMTHAAKNDRMPLFLGVQWGKSSTWKAINCRFRQILVSTLHIITEYGKKKHPPQKRHNENFRVRQKNEGVRQVFSVYTKKYCRVRQILDKKLNLRIWRVEISQQMAHAAKKHMWAAIFTMKAAKRKCMRLLKCCRKEVW